VYLAGKHLAEVVYPLVNRHQDVLHPLADCFLNLAQTVFIVASIFSWLVFTEVLNFSWLASPLGSTKSLSRHFGLSINL
jgi:hypothetical protein